jgi:N-acetylglucosaminyldiphosphoundecaprenol N-acetyl-beta-D-mannosaminyltransferase
VNVAVQPVLQREVPLLRDLRREVHGLLGVPIDVTDLERTIAAIRSAVASNIQFFVSTVNVNFLIASRSDPEFRMSLLLSDLCTVDGMPIVWLARILGVPLPERVSGADIFQFLRQARDAKPLALYLFGGVDGVAAALCARLNSQVGGLRCAGFCFPGFGDMDSMSRPTFIEEINSSGADFLAVALGARKGQAWLVRNRDILSVPVRVHLGASINFEAGTIRRASKTLQMLGLEWLWRIKEEPHLWSRYLYDAIGLSRILVCNVLPLIFGKIIEKWRALPDPGFEVVTGNDGAQDAVVSVRGSATASNVSIAAGYFDVVLDAHKDVVIDLSAVQRLDSRFLGFLLMVNKVQLEHGLTLRFQNVPRSIRRKITQYGFSFLLN